MTGTDISRLRRGIGVDHVRFADLLGVSASTVYRWEAAGDGPARLEPGAMRLLQALQTYHERQVAKRSADERQAQKAAAPAASAGDELAKAIAIGGGLFALFKLLEVLFEDRKG